jgi:hypothetical protein
MSSLRSPRARLVVVLIPALTLIGMLDPTRGVFVSPSVRLAGDPVVAVAGDVACDPLNPDYNGGLGNGKKCQEVATGQLVRAGSYDAVLALGDLQYDCGGKAAFFSSYDQSWGSFKSITYPTPGNHEYKRRNNSTGTDCGGLATARGYFDYFTCTAPPVTPCTSVPAPAPGNFGEGYYSFDLGAWHIISLNTNCRFTKGCKAGSPQERWLAADLSAHPNAQYPCTLAFWHQPRFASGKTVGADASSAVFWRDLYNAGADLVLNGHLHAYERFAPQDPDASADPGNGITEMIVGSGGEGYQGITATPAANSVVRKTKLNGILSLTLRPSGFDWRFVNVPGQTFQDSGSADCH